MGLENEFDRIAARGPRVVATRVHRRVNALRVVHRRSHQILLLELGLPYGSVCPVLAHCLDVGTSHVIGSSRVIRSFRVTRVDARHNENGSPTQQGDWKHCHFVDELYLTTEKFSRNFSGPK